jgi:drug/metabolite transporter (DMT)-like permease
MKLSETAVVLNEIAQEISDAGGENDRWMDALLTASRFFQHDPRQMLAVWLFVGSLLATVAGLVLLTVGVVQGFMGSSAASSACLFASALCWALALVLTKFTEKR